jgi:Alpha-kinase family
MNEEKKETDEFTHASSGALLSIENAAPTRRRRPHGSTDPKTVQMAMKARFHSPTVHRYTAKDIVTIVDDAQQVKEVTLIPNPWTLQPVQLDLLTMLNHSMSRVKVSIDRDCWTSNTVIVVDTSGSMRTSEFLGPPSDRASTSIWVSEVLYYLAQRLECGSARDTDVISIISMGEEPDMLVREQPCTWVLYNEILELHKLSHLLQDRDERHFLPSLAQAEELFTGSTIKASGPNTLLFLSDGTPSDPGSFSTLAILRQVASLATELGPPFTFSAIGIGSSGDFSILHSMVDAAKNCGAQAEFKRSLILQRKMRDMSRVSSRRSSIHEIRTHVSSEDFRFYPRDCVTQKKYYESKTNNGLTVWIKLVPMQHSDAKFVAISKVPFAEGTERVAFECFEVAWDRRTILGPFMVVKECKILHRGVGSSDGDASQQCARIFCKTQNLAQRIATKFNAQLRSNPLIHGKTPQVSFLDCAIYELRDKDVGAHSVVVEEKLDHRKWHNWNTFTVETCSEAGYQQSMLSSQVTGIDEISCSLSSLNLDMIEENSEEEDEISDEESVKSDSQPVIFSPSQVAQAFSHFSYSESRGMRLLCGLQGVCNDATNVLQLSDPVIHHYSHHGLGQKNGHRRTDRGRKGIEDFFAKHSCREHCGGLCQLVKRGFAAPRQRSKAKCKS